MLPPPWINLHGARHWPNGFLWAISTGTCRHYLARGSWSQNGRMLRKERERETMQEKEIAREWEMSFKASGWERERNKAMRGETTSFPNGFARKNGEEGQREIEKERGGREREILIFFSSFLSPTWSPLVRAFQTFFFFFLNRVQLPSCPLLKGIKVPFCPLEKIWNFIFSSL